MKILSLVMAAAWFVGQVSAAVSSSDDSSFNEDNNIVTGGHVELKRVIIMHRSGTTATTKKSAGSSEASWPVFPTTSKTTTSMMVDGNDDGATNSQHDRFADDDTDHQHDTDHHHHHQQHDWVAQPPPPQEEKEQRQLQTRHEQACQLMYDDLIVENPGASCECKRVTATFTCVNPSGCLDEELTNCVGGEPVCGFVTNIYGYYIEGTTVVVNTQRSITQYTSGGASLLGRELQVIGYDRCDYFMTTLDGLRYQCNDCSSTDCQGDDMFNVDCSNIQADSTTHGQCLPTNTTADLGLLNSICVEGPIVPNTLPVPVPSAAGFWHKNVMLAIMAALTCSLLMITCRMIASLNRTRRERTAFAIPVGEQQQLVQGSDGSA
jgi:hypothetical protein